MTEDIQKFESRAVQENSTETFLVEAIRQKYDPDIIREMMQLQRELKADLAKEAFFEAVAAFKTEAPKVKKDKHNTFFDSWYTSLGCLLDTYNPILGRFGLSLSFPSPVQTDKSMTAECRLSHRWGHSESAKMTGPIDIAAVGKQSGQRSRNPIQDVKSTFTYLRAVTCEAVLGVAGTEGTLDDDGNAADVGTEFITKEQAEEITELIKSCGKQSEWILGKILGLAKAETVDTILQTDFDGLVDWANKAKKKIDSRDPGEEG